MKKVKGTWVFDEKDIHQVEALAPFLTSEQIADYFMISRSVFYAVMDRQPEVKERYLKGKAKVLARVAQSLVQDALDGDRASKMFYLKTRGGWKETDDKSDQQVASLAESITQLISKLPN